jgi:uncharacterized protein
MIYVIKGMFKPDALAALPHQQAALNEHLGQMKIQPKLAGKLIDRDGRQVGFMACLEADSFEAADAYLANSPYQKTGLYSSVEILGFPIEVGAGQLD